MTAGACAAEGAGVMQLRRTIRIRGSLHRLREQSERCQKQHQG